MPITITSTDEADMRRRAQQVVGRLQAQGKTGIAIEEDSGLGFFRAVIDYSAPRRIVTEYDPHTFGWRAHWDDMGGDDSPYGYGATEAEAEQDLVEISE